MLALAPAAAGLTAEARARMSLVSPATANEGMAVGRDPGAGDQRSAVAAAAESLRAVERSTPLPIAVHPRVKAPGSALLTGPAALERRTPAAGDRRESEASTGAGSTNDEAAQGFLSSEGHSVDVAEGRAFSLQTFPLSSALAEGSPLHQALETIAAMKAADDSQGNMLPGGGEETSLYDPEEADVAKDERDQAPAPNVLLLSSAPAPAGPEVLRHHTYHMRQPPNLQDYRQGGQVDHPKAHQLPTLSTAQEWSKSAPQHAWQNGDSDREESPSGLQTLLAAHQGINSLDELYDKAQSTGHLSGGEEGVPSTSMQSRGGDDNLLKPKHAWLDADSALVHEGTQSGVQSVLEAHQDMNSLDELLGKLQALHTKHIPGTNESEFAANQGKPDMTSNLHMPQSQHGWIDVDLPSTAASPQSSLQDILAAHDSLASIEDLQNVLQEYSNQGPSSADNSGLPDKAQPAAEGPGLGKDPITPGMHKAGRFADREVTKADASIGLHGNLDTSEGHGSLGEPRPSLRQGPEPLMNTKPAKSAEDPPLGRGGAQYAPTNMNIRPSADLLSTGKAFPSGLSPQLNSQDSSTSPEIDVTHRKLQGASTLSAQHMVPVRQTSQGPASHQQVLATRHAWLNAVRKASGADVTPVLPVHLTPHNSNLSLQGLGVMRQAQPAWTVLSWAPSARSSRRDSGARRFLVLQVNCMSSKVSLNTVSDANNRSGIVIKPHDPSMVKVISPGELGRTDADLLLLVFFDLILI